jgi:hypothetical protein
MNVFFNRTFDACNSKIDDLKFTIKALTAFPYWENCSANGGKFCDKEKKISVAAMSAFKVFDIFGLGNIRIQATTKFDGGRSSCTSVDISVTKY